MKRIHCYARLLLLATVVISVSSCKKVAEEILKDPCADIKFCNLKSYTFSGIHPSYPANTATFTYDVLGNPLTVNNTVVGTGYPNLIFKYDAAHRLTEFIRLYDNGLFETWSKYAYDASGKIVSDSIFVFGTVTPTGPTGSWQVRLDNYTYDGSCRILQVSTTTVGDPSPATISNFSYDLSGNLVRPGIVYDNKVNIHRTNKIFMFVDRDYSMNNPFTATTYNAYSLPWTISSPATINPKLLFLQRPIDNASFIYQCD